MKLMRFTPRPSLSSKSGDRPALSVIVPAYNEGARISEAIAQVVAVLDSCGPDWELLLVDDGSRDDTYAQIRALAQTDARIKGLSFSRNFGKEAALLAGLQHASGSAVITMDADLQHPPGLIPDMLALWRDGAQIVHAVKRSRGDETAGKRFTAWCFNRAISRLGRINIHNASDFKLLDRQIVDIIVHQLPERDRFFRGLTSWVGFSETFVEFDVPARQNGHSKWSFWALAGLSLTALTSFTSLPLRIITVFGFATLGLGFVIGGEALWSWLHGQAVSGFATIIMTLLLIGSFIMISLGIIGEYIARIYEELKDRPPFLIKSSVGIAQRVQEELP